MAKENANMQTDPVFDKINDRMNNDKKVAMDFTNDIIDMLHKGLKRGKLNLTQVYIALADALIGVTQALCEDEEHYKAEYNIANKMATNKVIPVFLPKLTADGKIPEDYDKENLSIRRIMFTLASSIEYALWRGQLAYYQGMREQEEEQEENK